MQTMDVMILSKNPLRPARQFTKQDHDTFELPTLLPIHHSIGLSKKHIYNIESFYRE